jgi:hypothetical protein
MKFYRFFLTLSRGKQIGLAVCAVHFLTLFSLLTHHLISRTLKRPRPIVIKTIQAIPPSKIEIAAKPMTPVAQNKHAQPQPAAPKPLPEKKSAPPKPTPQPKKVAPNKQNQKVLQEVQEQLSAIGQEAKRPNRPSLTLPSKIQPKALPKIEESPNPDPTYQEFLIAFLQNTLNLPEYGEVKAQIEIDRFGKLIACHILQSKNVKNSEFLKNQLPELSFPCLNDFGITDKSLNLTITFYNAEIH